MDLESKYLGGMIGSALGDCIGQLAFFHSSKESLLNAINQSSTLTYTDDTAMAIGLAESILKNQGKIVSQKLGKTFHENYKEEPNRGYAKGPPTIFSMVERNDVSYVEIAEILFNGEGSFGNGAAMRITPLGLFFHDSTTLYEEARLSSMVTHTHLLGIDGAAVLAKAISLVTTKDSQYYDIRDNRSSFILSLRNFAKTEEFSLQLNKVKDLSLQKEDLEQAETILGSNITAQDSVPFAIFAFLENPHNFGECLLQTVLVAEDKDTIGAMVGGLLGSYLGIEKIPVKWKAKLENLLIIETLAKNLTELKFTKQ